MATHSIVLGLENLRDGGVWWAAIYGIAQSRTWLKQLSSSSSVIIFVFILFGTVCFSWIFLSFPMLGKFSAIMSSNMVFNPFLLSSPSGTPMLWISVSLILSQSSLKLTSLKIFFFYLSLFSFCSGWVISAALSSILLIHSTVSSNLLLIPSSVF